jgi:beta-glucosidase
MKKFLASVVALPLFAGGVPSLAQDSEFDVRARETEQQMTDERFSLIISLMGAVPLIGQPRDPRIPEDVTNMSAGYTPGVPRLGVPALQSSDASMGVTNPAYRPDDKGATAFPASIVVGSSFKSRARARRRRRHRPRGADQGLQHPARRRHQSRPRRPQRPEFRVLL